MQHVKETEKELSRNLQLQRDQYEATVQRHLTFIDQVGMRPQRQRFSQNVWSFQQCKTILENTMMGSGEISPQENLFKKKKKIFLSLHPQLIGDKKALSERCEGLMAELKLVDHKYTKKISQMQEQHKMVTAASPSPSGFRSLPAHTHTRAHFVLTREALQHTNKCSNGFP